MNQHHFALIMAGGIGTRFWPMSHTRKPKQFYDILGIGKTFIQQTFDRLNQFIETKNIYIITTADYIELTLEQLPQISIEQIIVEPVGMNTGPCNLFGALKIYHKDPMAQIIVAPSDHLIMDEQTFKEKALKAFEFSEQNKTLLTLGIKPTRPDTGYGYIQFVDGENEVKKVKTFTEKPNADLAKSFINSGDFLWNAGIFIWSAATIIEEFKLHQHEIYHQFLGIQKSIGTAEEDNVVQKIYPTVSKISVDNGILELSDKVYVIPSSFGWSDLGTWNSLYQYQKEESKENLTQGKHVFVYDSNGCLIKNNTKQAMVIDGLTDYIVVNTEDALLICPRSNDQKVKNFVNDLKLNKAEQFT